MLEIHWIENARNQKSTFDLSWTIVKDPSLSYVLNLMDLE